MSFVKNGRPILINCIAWGRRYLPEVAIISITPKTTSVIIIFLYLFWLKLVLRDLSTKRITIINTKTITNLIITNKDIDI